MTTPYFISTVHSIKQLYKEILISFFDLSSHVKKSLKHMILKLTNYGTKVAHVLKMGQPIHGQFFWGNLYILIHTEKLKPENYLFKTFSYFLSLSTVLSVRANFLLKKFSLFSRWTFCEMVSTIELEKSNLHYFRMVANTGRYFYERFMK